MSSSSRQKSSTSRRTSGSDGPKTDLEPIREADAKLVRSLEQLRTRLETSRRQVGVDRDQLQRVVTYGLDLAGAPPLRAVGDGGGTRPLTGSPKRTSPPIRDPEILNTLSTLRAPAARGQSGHLRPIAFEPPEDVDAETVQLHLEHPMVRRLLDRFTNQGLVHHDLSRACLAVSPGRPAEGRAARPPLALGRRCGAPA